MRVPRGDALGAIRRIRTPGTDLVAVTGDDPVKMLHRGLDAVGGLKAIVKPGDRVVLSPNFALARPQGTGAVTNAELVRETIKLCFEARAREVTCLDNTYARTPRAFRINGALEAVEGTGARLLSPWSAEQYVVINDFLRAEVHREMLEWQAVPEVLLRADVLINMPVFKHHKETRVSGAMKKLMGCIWRRAAYHEADLHGCIAELGTVIRPTLNIMDGMRILTTNGPDGPGKLVDNRQLLLGVDPVLMDTYACSWMGLRPQQVGYLARASKLEAGSIDVGRARVAKFNL
jgi:uncharacterized protein (DUF362 family)